MAVWIKAGVAAHADEDAVSKYRDYLPKQLLALSEDERRNR